MKDRVIHKVVVVPAMIDEVWEAWTTSAGARTFFGSDAKIELAIGGRFEIYFDKNEPPGRRGSKRCKVLSYLPKEMLSFSWNSPPEIPAMRNVYIWVVVQFEQMETHSTRVTLTHLGWQEGPEWDKSYAYFNRAWGTVLFLARPPVSSRTNRLEQSSTACTEVVLEAIIRSFSRHHSQIWS